MADEYGKPQKPYIRPIAVADLELGIANASRPLRVFVAGPYIERNWSAAEMETKPKAAHRRIDIIEHVERQLSHGALLGEHRGVLEVGEKRLRSRSSAAITELKLVRENCDAIVILPSSPGSFSELGTWCVYEDVCRKMLIIADKQFEGVGGYLSFGVFKTAEDNGATLLWIDYADREGVVNAVGEYLDQIQDLVNVRSIIKT